MALVLGEVNSKKLVEFIKILFCDTVLWRPAIMLMQVQERPAVFILTVFCEMIMRDELMTLNP